VTGKGTHPRRENGKRMKAMEIVELKPVIVGGDPIDPNNKGVLTRQQHFEFVRYWNRLIREHRAASSG
jgi:hypothetical protein